VSRTDQAFADFYAVYLAHHRHPLNRALHLSAKLLAAGSLLGAAGLRSFLLLLAAPILAVAPCWLGHLWFEGNRPVSWERPSASLLGTLAGWAARLRPRRPAPEGPAERRQAGAGPAPAPPLLRREAGGGPAPELLLPLRPQAGGGAAAGGGPAPELLLPLRPQAGGGAAAGGGPAPAAGGRAYYSFLADLRMCGSMLVPWRTGSSRDASDPT
jgi:hypothetical protein